MHVKTNVTLGNTVAYSCLSARYTTWRQLGVTRHFSVTLLTSITVPSTDRVNSKSAFHWPHQIRERFSLTVSSQRVLFTDRLTQRARFLLTASTQRTLFTDRINSETIRSPLVGLEFTTMALHTYWNGPEKDDIDAQFHIHVLSSDESF